MNLRNSPPASRRRQSRIEIHMLILRGYLRDILSGLSNEETEVR